MSSSGLSWPKVRSSLADTTARFAALLRAAPDPSALAIGEWSVGDVAAHVMIVVGFDSYAIADSPLPPWLEPLKDQASDEHGDVTDVERLNAESLGLLPERRPHVLAGEIERSVGALLRGSESREGDTPIAWLGGMKLRRAAIAGHLVEELLVHGLDIARATGQPWPIDPASAGHAYEFLLELVGAGADRMVPDNAPPAPVSCEFRVRGHAPATFRYGGGRLTVDRGSAAPVDVHISAAPEVMLPMMFNRITKVAAVRHGVRVWGRRPWRLRRLLNVMQLP